MDDDNDDDGLNSFPLKNVLYAKINSLPNVFSVQSRNSEIQRVHVPCLNPFRDNVAHLSLIGET